MQVYDSMALWLEGFKSHATKKSYQVHLTRFCAFHRLTPDELVQQDAKAIKRLIIEYLIHLRKVAKNTAGKPKPGEISVNSIHIYLAGVYSFLDSHEILIPKKSIERYYPEQVTNSFRAYTRAEIAKLLTLADLRERCIILLMVSSGIRIGAFRWLKYKDLRVIGDMALLTVYAFSKQDRYVTFVTPECMKTLSEYRQLREAEGEKITDETPLIRDKVRWMSERTNKAHPISDVTIRIHLKKLLRKSLLYSDSIQPAHAFRKFFNTACKNAGMDKDFKELFMGHSIKLDDTYYDVDDEQSQAKLHSEYMKAVDSLTIDDKHRLQKQVKELTVEKTEWQKTTSQLNSALDQLRAQGIIK